MRKTAFSITAAFALALSACGGNDEEGDLKGEVVAAVAAPDGASWVDTVAVTEEGGYLIGNPDAKIKLIEYASYTCPACANFSKSASEELTNDYINSGRVSFEFRNFIRDPLDLAVARTIRCAPKESFYALSEQFMGAQGDILGKAQQIDQATAQKIGALKPMERPLAYGEAIGLVDFFAQRGISRDQVKSCLSDEKELQALADMVEGYTKKYDIPGTPTFFVNGNKLQVAGWAPLKKILQDAGAREE